MTASEALNLRSGPGTSYPVIDWLEAGQILTILEPGQWAKVRTTGGAVGYVSFSGNLDMAITIRTACIQDGKLTVRAGAGIVADSDPERERMETVNKARAIQKALELLQYG